MFLHHDAQTLQEVEGLKFPSEIGTRQEALTTHAAEASPA